MLSRRGVVRAAASAAFAVALAMGAMAPGVALAEDTVGTDTGTITVDAVESNAGVTYDVYKIFTCDVDAVTDSAGTYAATNIDWASNDMKTAILTAIHAYDNTVDTSGWSAQQAADYLAPRLNPDNVANLRVEANVLAENIVKAIIKAEITPSTLTADTSTSMAEGYYLIVSTPSSISGSMTGTSPIFTMLGNGQNLTISEKTSIPTLGKTLTGDTLTSGGTYADVQAGQEMTVTLVGTVADSINTFTSYAYTFEDTLPAGMDLVCAGSEFDEAKDVVVSVDSQEIDPAYYTATYTSGKLSVNFEADGADTSNDLKSVKNKSGNAVSVSSSSNVTVTYRARLNASAAVGTANTSSATLTYANDPQHPETTGTSVAHTVSLYEYKLNLNKKDANGTTALSGAKFTIQATGADDDASKNQYVKTDGTFGGTSLPATSATDYNDYIFTTGTDGSISVKGLDAGTYTITEIEAPANYTKAPALSLKITPNFDTGGALTSLGATLSGGNGDTNTKVVEGTEAGVITIQVTNAAGMVLPVTGLPGITLVYVVGGLILVISLAVIVRRRLKSQK